MKLITPIKRAWERCTDAGAWVGMVLGELFGRDAERHRVTGPEYDDERDRVIARQTDQLEMTRLRLRGLEAQWADEKEMRERAEARASINHKRVHEVEVMLRERSMFTLGEVLDRANELESERDRLIDELAVLKEQYLRDCEPNREAPTPSQDAPENRMVSDPDLLPKGAL